jgi:hypothetical protein
VLNEVRQSLRAQPNVYDLGADVDAFDQQLHNADLLRREQFIPERIEPFPSSPAMGLDGSSLGRRWRNLSKGLALRKHVPFVLKPSWAGRLDRCAASSIDVVAVRLQPNIRVGAAKGGEQIDVQRLRQPDPLQRLPRSI